MQPEIGVPFITEKKRIKHFVIGIYNTDSDGLGFQKLGFGFWMWP